MQSTIEDLEKDPVLKPLLEYEKAKSILGKGDESESSYLEKKMMPLMEALKTGIYDQSHIAKLYSDVVEVYKRLLFIYAQYTELADEKVEEVKKIVDEYYITKKEHIKLSK